MDHESSGDASRTSNDAENGAAASAPEQANGHRPLNGNVVAFPAPAERIVRRSTAGLHLTEMDRVLHDILGPLYSPLVTSRLHVRHRLSSTMSDSIDRTPIVPVLVDPTSSGGEACSISAKNDSRLHSRRLPTRAQGGCGTDGPTSEKIRTRTTDAECFSVDREEALPIPDIDWRFSRNKSVLYKVAIERAHASIAKSLLRLAIELSDEAPTT